ncbi:MAG: L-tyrosine/L-tryptophan isonitrile synthase family protein [Bdellovibrionaceae bacterium]|nr:isocyanide synthase family protein [Bdellovibrionales bacterium]MCB9255029.1 L-tyrosine/L-tryptophan isonitrile synthase family protein [Pseudobdellovibrionaceae bacterium]
MVLAEQSCETDCPACVAPHFQKAVAAVRAGKPVEFVLPAFPGKSPNPDKVLGHLPDMAELKALQFLDSLCRQIEKIYRPGARLVLCSDGRVFSDLVGMKESHVSAYQAKISQIIAEHSLSTLSTFNLDESYGGKNFASMRLDLMEEYGQPLDTLKEKVRRGGKGSETQVDQEAHRMYCGITRFLFEDALVPGQTKSRTAIQKESRTRAYEVIRRSNAWSELVAKRFPGAIRLSIHPQSCGARKLGIQLLAANNWLTPWHGVALSTGNEFVLTKRSHAEKIGAKLVLDGSGQPSHYELKGSC